MVQIWSISGYKEAVLQTPATDVFSNVSPNRYLPFYEDDHTDLKSVANFLDYSNDDVAKIAGVSEQSVRFKGRVPQAVKDRLLEIANICELVANNFKGDVEKTALWFRMENPMLGNISPKDMIRFGRYKKLRKFILDSIDGNLP